MFQGAVPLFGLVGYFLAKDKERPVLLWTILCALPGVGPLFLAFLVGSTSLRLERKLDALLKECTLEIDTEN